jgi:hypothetical protein
LRSFSSPIAHLSAVVLHQYVPVGLSRRGVDAYIWPQKPGGVHALHQGGQYAGGEQTEGVEKQSQEMTVRFSRLSIWRTPSAKLQQTEIQALRIRGTLTPEFQRTDYKRIKTIWRSLTAKLQIQQSPIVEL